jgi:peptidoglycan/LPS O-acetylase OafA/YrhL
MRLGQVPVLDAVRGSAVLVVLVAHTNHVLPSGVLGVDLFFVLSGFLITSLLLTEWDATGAISLRAFYRRRALRLLPALVVMLAILTAVLAATGGLDQFVWVLLSFGYVVNVAAIFEGEIAAPSLKHMWSLSQEEQFYLVWPLALFLAIRARARPQNLALMLGAVAVVVVAWRAFLAVAQASPGYLLYAPETRSVGLIVGCLGGVLFGYGLVRRVPLWLASAMLVPAGAAVALLGNESRWDAVVLLPVFCIAAVVVLLGCVLHPDWWFARVIDRSWLRGLGKISYALYLWHWPLYFAFGWMLGLPLAIVVACLSYRFVEQPFLQRRYLRGDQTATAPRRKSTISPVVAPGPKTSATPAALSSSASS